MIMLFHHLLDVTVERAPLSVALRYQDRSLTFQELSERSRLLASALRARGLAPGDRVAVYLQNRPEVVELAVACSRIGCIFVPLNPLLRGRQLAHALRDCMA